MSGEVKPSDEGFLGRWSRRKVEARESEPMPMPVQESAPVVADEPRPELPALDELTLDSDFRGFFHPEVGEDVRRAALRKLFSDPHFNVMDGLDVYIDDYSKTEPIPPAMLAGLRQAQRIMRWAEDKDDPEESISEHDSTLADTESSAVPLKLQEHAGGDRPDTGQHDSHAVAELPLPAGREAE